TQEAPALQIQHATGKYSLETPPERSWTTSGLAPRFTRLSWHREGLSSRALGRKQESHSRSAGEAFSQATRRRGSSGSAVCSSKGSIARSSCSHRPTSSAADQRTRQHQRVNSLSSIRFVSRDTACSCVPSPRAVTAVRPFG